MDTISKQRRSLNMSHIKSKNTSIELMVRKSLYKMGYRYRVNVKDLPGKPDIVLKRYNTIIFVNGCFWHQHRNCKYASMPKTNTDYWYKKLHRNIIKDQITYDELRKKGWYIIILWECELKGDFETIIMQVDNTLKMRIKE